MAFVNFYLIAAGTGSADINAGSSIGAAQATTTNGSWNSGTGVFIAASGTPFASTIVGDYASVYIDGATVTTFVGIVTVKTSSTQITVDVATIKYGTAPSTSATARSCTINGSWNTEQVLAAGGLAGTTAPQSTKINIKGNLTITASRTIGMVGTTTIPVWFAGYNTTPGDLDADTTNSLAKPIWTLNATFGVTGNGTYQIWSALSIVGNRSSAIWTAGGAQRYVRCRVENTSSNAAAYAFEGNRNQMHAQYCWFKAPATGTSTAVANQLNGVFVGVTVENGGFASFSGGSDGPTFLMCVSLNSGGVGFLGSTGVARYQGCTVSNSTSDGIKWTGTPGSGTGLPCVIGCLFRAVGGYGINNASGANTANVVRACNDFYSCSQGPENGFGDYPAFFGQTDSADPVTSASNMTPVAGSNARNNGFPGIFENETFSSYADIGAVRHQDPAGYAGGVYGA